MLTSRSVARTLRLLPVLCALAPCPAQVAAEGGEGLTFYGWSDQHVTVEGDYEHCLPYVDALNALPGTPSPGGDGETVAEPAFVLGGGDITEWPSHAAIEGYKALIARLRWPTVDLAGNHDDGGKSPNDAVLDWVRERHGALDYSFDAGGVHFVCLFTTLARDTDSPAGPIFPETLRFLRADLAAQPREKPVVVAMHHCADSLTNTEEFLAAIEGWNVVLVLGGHYHQPVSRRIGGVWFHQLPSPRPTVDVQAVSVVRITPERLTVSVWDFARKEWLAQHGVDVPIRGPSAAGYTPVTANIAAPAMEGVLHLEEFREAPPGLVANANGEGVGVVSPGALRLVGGHEHLGFVLELQPGVRPERHVWISLLTRSADLRDVMMMTGVQGGPHYADWGLRLPDEGWGLVSVSSLTDFTDFAPGESYLRFLNVWADNAATAGWEVDAVMIAYYRPPVLSAASDDEAASVRLSWTPASDVTTGDALAGYRITRSVEAGAPYRSEDDVSGLLAPDVTQYVVPRAEAGREAFTLWCEMTSGALWRGLTRSVAD